jgi:poly(3-hydroxybutyrate) depolymerase
MKKMTGFFFAFLYMTGVSAHSREKDSVLLQTATAHPMQYYVSLPDGWTKEKTWPIVVVIESADKEYKENALRFVRARKQMPFIIVAPYNVNNSRFGRRDPAIFPYSPQTWDYIEQVGDCQFNMDGLTQVVKDVQAKYNGEEKYYLTGFEAGTHTVWQMVFQHPERLKAAVAVAGNYNRNSCMSDPAFFSNDLSRVVLPVAGFSAAHDSFYGPRAPNYAQWLAAQKTAIDHGYRKLIEFVIPGKSHVPLPDEVMNYFYALLTEEKKE